MRLCLLGCLFLGFAAGAAAHRLDEYLQSARVAVASNRVDITFYLAPGGEATGQLLVVIDRDGDGVVSEAEGQAYARDFLKDIQLSLDGKAITPGLMEVAFPTVDEFEEGMGVIRIGVAANVFDLAVGEHVLSLTNAHLPEISVYQVNALRRTDPRIRIRKQVRNGLQADYRLEFEVALPEAVPQ
jgi:hypothetical protein